MLDYPGSSSNILRIRADLGEKGLLCVRQGLSRPISPDAEEVRLLINDWERNPKCDNCCFQGTVDDLLNMKRLKVIAISYRHEYITRWHKHGEDKISKMTDCDQKILGEAIDKLKHYDQHSQIILWCDQILSARLKGEENELGWYNAGLIPFAYLPVLALSTSQNQSVNELEKRVWIKAERSLGRMGRGLVEAYQLSEYFNPFAIFECSPREDFNPERNKFGECVSPKALMKTVSFLILSGYWPEPEKTDFWYADYGKMKRWAIHVSCKSDRLEDSVFFDLVAPVDFTDILRNMQKFSAVPQGSGFAEGGYFVRDKHFYLKATAWNPWISDLWPKGNRNVSHYMGKLGDVCKFTWWVSSPARKIFGCLVSDTKIADFEKRGLVISEDHRNEVERLNRKEAPPTIVIAEEKESGFVLFRYRVSPEVCDLYVHSERNPSQEMKKVFQSAARDDGIDINLDEQWSLLFTWDSMNEASQADEIVNITPAHDDKAVFQVPHVLMGTTAGLFQAASSRDSGSSITGTYTAAIHNWNEHIKGSFDKYVHVTDSEYGPVWLEGYTKNYVTFGFLDFLTRTLFVQDAHEDQVAPIHHEVLMPTEQEFKHRILIASKDATEDVQLIAEELFRDSSAQNYERATDDHEKAGFMISGGFTNTFTGFAVEPFLCTVAKRRGYWRTRVRCRNKKMQIVFTSHENAARMAQRSTNLTDYDAVGLVRPGNENCVFVRYISEELSEKEARSPHLWKDMQDTFSRAEATSQLPDAKLPWGGAEAWLIDTTLCVDTDQGIVFFYDTAEVADQNDEEIHFPCPPEKG
ncbi:hypothetical protein FGB62_367g00 [Gracilaria domingensis]|nr:hypothetical protein FGB62_367g00 [Gracilaria domingensis]